MSARAFSCDVVVREPSPCSSSSLSFREMIGDDVNNVDDSEEDPSSRRSASFRDACSSPWSWPAIEGPRRRSGRRRDICRASSWARRSASLRQDDRRCRSSSASPRTSTAGGSGRTAAAVPDASAGANGARRCWHRHGQTWRVGVAPTAVSATWCPRSSRWHRAAARDAAAFWCASECRCQLPSCVRSLCDLSSPWTRDSKARRSDQWRAAPDSDCHRSLCSFDCCPSPRCRSSRRWAAPGSGCRCNSTSTL